MVGVCERVVARFYKAGPERITSAEGWTLGGGYDDNSKVAEKGSPVELNIPTNNILRIRTRHCSMFIIVIPISRLRLGSRRLS